MSTLQAWRRRRTPTAWLAVVVLLWMSAAPLLSHLVLRATPQAEADICSLTGAKWRRAKPVDADSGHERLPHVYKRCPFCALHQDSSPPLASAPPLAWIALALTEARPDPWQQPALQTHSALAAQPRGPPPRA